MSRALGRWVVVCGVAAVVAGLVEMTLKGTILSSHGWVAASAVTMMGAALLLSGRRPVAGAAGLGTCVVVASVAGAAPVFPVTGAALLAVHGCAVGSARPIRTVLVGLALLITGAEVANVIGGESLFIQPVLILAGSTAGWVLRSRQDLVVKLHDTADDLERERETFADLSIRYERSRIAAELHDLVGHAISIVVVQAMAGQRLAEGEPARVGSTFSTIAGAARAGADDLGRLLELLGAPDDGSVTADLALIEQLAERAATTGLRVSCRIDCGRSEVSPEVGRLAYRVAQEGLTNALRYAPGAAVDLVVNGAAQRDPQLVVSVANSAAAREGAPPVIGGSQGLRGLRERVEAVGGSLTAGPQPNGGWRVEARLPASLGPALTFLSPDR